MSAPRIISLQWIMSKISELLKLAHQRAFDANLSYDGALLPVEAFSLLGEADSALLVDVRTKAELDWVGFVPDALHLEWQNYPACQRNEKFIELLRQAVPEEALLLFLCRSGVRSHAAASAAAAAGLGPCYNILHGFEGDRDEQGHRNAINGWRAAGLPWKQG